MDEIKEKLHDIFDKVAIYIEEEDEDQELVVNSLQFAKILFYIEDEFDICLGADGTNIEYDKLKTFNDYLCMINEILATN